MATASLPALPVAPKVVVEWESQASGCAETGLVASTNLVNWVEVARLPYTTNARVTLVNRPAREFYRAFYSPGSKPVPTKLRVVPPKPDLLTSLNQSIQALVAGKSSNQWEWLSGSTNSWVHPVNLTGLSLSFYPVNNPSYLGGKFTSADIMMITQRHGVSAAHASGGATNVLVVFGVPGGTRPTFITNLVVASRTLYNDLAVVTLASNLPPAIKPFYLFPPTFTNYFPRSVDALSGSQMIWYRNNSRRMNVVGTSRGFESPIGPYAYYVAADLRYPEIPFTEQLATAGDSSGPVFWVLDGKPILGCSILGPTPDGAFLTRSLDFIQAQLGTNQLNFIDLSRYERYR